MTSTEAGSPNESARVVARLLRYVAKACAGLPGLDEKLSFRGATKRRERVASASVAIAKDDHRSLRVELVATRDPAYLLGLAKIVASIRAAK